MKTLTGVQTKKSTLVDDLLVKSTDSCDDHWIKLPKTYSRSSISVSIKESPTPTKIRQWTYLKDVPDQLCDERDVKIGLLIGANCPRALEPEKVISSQDGGPYAFKTRLGWCVVGPMAQMPNESAKFCNKINVTSLNNEPVSHQFCVVDKWKDLRRKIRRTNDLEKIEEATIHDDLEVSQEDLQFMELMCHKVKLRDSHYGVPLLFRCGDLKLPKNESMAIRRAESLK